MEINLAEFESICEMVNYIQIHAKDTLQTQDPNQNTTPDVKALLLAVTDSLTSEACNWVRTTSFRESFPFLTWQQLYGMTV